MEAKIADDLAKIAENRSEKSTYKGKTINILVKKLPKMEARSKNSYDLMQN